MANGHAQKRELNPAEKLESILKLGIDEKYSDRRVAQEIIDIGWARVASILLGKGTLNDRVRTAWDNYYGIVNAERGRSGIINYFIDSKAEDHMETLVEVMRERDEEKGRSKGLTAIKVAEVYCLCGYDAERMAEHVASTLGLVNINRVTTTDVVREGHLRYEVEGGAVYYYEHDELFRKCWDKYYKEAPTSELAKERFEELMSHGGQFYDYPQVIGDSLLQIIVDARATDALGSLLKNWWKEDDAWGKLWDILKFVLPADSVAYSATPSLSLKYKDAQANPNPENVLTAIRADQAYMIDTIATAAIIFKLAKVGAKISGATTSVSLTGASRQAVRKAAERVKTALEESGKLQGESLERVKRAVDDVVARIEAQRSGEVARHTDGSMTEIGGRVGGSAKVLFDKFKDLFRRFRGGTPEEFKQMVAELRRDFDSLPVADQCAVGDVLAHLETLAAQGGRQVGGRATGEGTRAAVRGVSRKVQQLREALQGVNEEIGKLTREIEELTGKTADDASRARLAGLEGEKARAIEKQHGILGELEKVGAREGWFRSGLGRIGQYEREVLRPWFREISEKVKSQSRLTRRFEDYLKEFERLKAKRAELVEKLPTMSVSHEKASATWELLNINSRIDGVLAGIKKLAAEAGVKTAPVLSFVTVPVENLPSFARVVWTGLKESLREAPYGSILQYLAARAMAETAAEAAAESGRLEGVPIRLRAGEATHDQAAVAIINAENVIPFGKERGLDCKWAEEKLAHANAFYGAGEYGKARKLAEEITTVIRGQIEKRDKKKEKGKVEEEEIEDEHTEPEAVIPTAVPTRAASIRTGEPAEEPEEAVEEVEEGRGAGLKTKEKAREGLSARDRAVDIVFRGLPESQRWLKAHLKAGVTEEQLRGLRDTIDKCKITGDGNIKQVLLYFKGDKTYNEIESALPEEVQRATLFRERLRFKEKLFR